MLSKADSVTKTTCSIFSDKHARLAQGPAQLRLASPSAGLFTERVLRDALADVTRLTSDVPDTVLANGTGRRPAAAS